MRRADQPTRQGSGAAASGEAGSAGRALTFGAEAERYARARPTYADEAVRFALPAVPCRVADVGAGTGKLTEVLLRLGCDVVAVEPDDAMRSRIRDAEALAGTAEELPLADASVDAVVAAQAYHWFDRERFLPEAARVLRPGGTLAVLWNWLDDSLPWVAEFAETAGSVDRLSLHAELGPPIHDARFEEAERRLVPHTVRHDPGSLVDLAASYSRTIALPPAERAALLDRVRALAERADRNLNMPYVTCVWRAGVRA